MEIKSFNEFLKENEGPHEYGCVMAFLPIDKKQWDEIQEKIDENDIYKDENDSSFGREYEIHVTLLYGLHDIVKDSDVKKICSEFKKPSVKLKKIGLFENEKFDVLKFDVECKELHDYNEELKQFPYTNSYPKYEPHCTIAYLKPGTGKKYLDIIQEPIIIEADKIVYSKANGSKLNWKFK